MKGNAIGKKIMPHKMSFSNTLVHKELKVKKQVSNVFMKKHSID